MTAIRSAIHAIEAEIATSQARIVQLEAALKSLKPLGDHVEPTPKTAKSAKARQAAAQEVAAVAQPDEAAAPADGSASGSVESAEPAKKKRGRKAGSAASGFPKTGSEFFYSVMGANRKTMNDLVEGSARKLEVSDEASMKILRARITSWLYPAVKAGYIVAAGEKNKLKAYQVAK
jgi:hypothetical protein